MDQIKRDRIYEGGNGVHERITINFNAGPVGNLKQLFVASQTSLSGNKVAVSIHTTNCTGIAGTAHIEQTMNDSGKPNVAYSPAITLALAASAHVHAGMDGTVINMMSARPVIRFAGFTPPTEGIMVIDIVTKF